MVLGGNMEVGKELLEEILDDVIELYNNTLSRGWKMTEKDQRLSAEYFARIVAIKRLLAGENVGKIKPCDCLDQRSVDKLSEQGIRYNNCSLQLQPNSVELKIGPCTVKVPQEIFKRFSEWYLGDQVREEDSCLE